MRQRLRLLILKLLQKPGSVFCTSKLFELSNSTCLWLFRLNCSQEQVNFFESSSSIVKAAESLLYRQIIFVRLCETTEPNKQITANDRNFNANWCEHFNCWKYVSLFGNFERCWKLRKRKNNRWKITERLQIFLFWKVWMKKSISRFFIFNESVGLFISVEVFVISRIKSSNYVLYDFETLFWTNFMSVSFLLWNEIQ